MDLFTNLSERFKFKDKKVRLFECFSGIGTQAMALKRLGVEVEHIGFSEIDKYAIQSYLAIHGDVKNYGDITKIKGIELPKIDILTWSFPCTDLSKAGKQKGLENTRSGLGYEVIRIIEEMKEKPTVLLMENVPDLIGSKFRKGWGEMYHAIEKLGYKNHVELLNSKNFGVAQNRNRVFMVSILGDYSYTFPKGFKLEKKLKDYLQNEVEENFYLSDKQLKQISNWKSYQNPLNNILKEDSKCPTITTRVAESDAGGISASMIVYGEPKIAYALGSREYAQQGWLDQAPTLCARDYKDPKVIMIPEATVQGYAVVQDGDGVYINRPHQKRGVVQKEMIQTIKTSGTDVGVVVGEHRRDEGIRTFKDDVIGTLRAKEAGGDKIIIEKTQRDYSEKSIEKILDNIVDVDGSSNTITANPQRATIDGASLIVVKGNYSPSNHNASRIVDKNGLAPTVMENHGTITAIVDTLRIRKLTPKECWRLMGISDEDYNKTKKVGMSNSQLYKQAGNAIVVDVLYYIFKQLF